MSKRRLPVDDMVGRKQAVDPEKSVLVQAPAGSGKTTLLVQRFLRLLGRVSSPEQILAITFTNKAAASMRERVLEFVHMTEPPEEAHEMESFRAAEAIRDRVQAWGLKENPSRLRIMTIDSFCARLARRMPVVSGLGKMPGLAKYPESLYREAARRVMQMRLVDSEELSGAIRRTLLWRDNDIDAVETLIAELLPAREKWLRVLGTNAVPERDLVEQALADVVTSEFDNHLHVVEGGLAAAGVQIVELFELAGLAAERLGRDTVLASKPEAARASDGAGQIAAWRELASALTTTGKAIRTRITKNEGFPPKDPATIRMKELLGLLRESCDEDFVSALLGLRDLPDPSYSDQAWGMVGDIIRVLQAAAVELEILFLEEGKVDFSGVSAASLRGLGTEDDPTDLALYMDHAIQHILMDECQDSNWTQFLLLERLVSGWERDDGRTLFLVGDPMQSIYRFRMADVSLFVQARDKGVGPVSLEFVQLSRNYRSTTEVVDWINKHVGPAFPEADDQRLGRIAYAPSVAARGSGGVVDVDVVCGRSRQDEAEALVERISDVLQTEEPDHEVAVLVRSRSHLAELIPALRAAGLDFNSLQLDKLMERPVIRDLNALTMALWHPADRSAWLSVLRAPWAGLTLEALFGLFGDDPKAPLSDAVIDPDCEGVDGWSAEQAQRVLSVLQDGLAAIGTRPFRDVIESCWKGLGGDHVYAAAEDVRDALRFLAIVDQFEESGQILDWDAFQRAVGDERSEGTVGASNLSIMTIHESKGLEFDTVFLPGLDRQPKVGDTALLEWLPLSTESGESLLLSPIRSSEEKTPTPLSKFIRNIDQLMEDEERKRLLYVASTRARQRLVISASPGLKNSGEARLSPLCMLHDLWPSLGDDIEMADLQDKGVGERPVIDQSLRRISEHWSAPTDEAMSLPATLRSRLLDTTIQFDWSQSFDKQVGRALHRCLELLGSAGLDQLDEHAVRTVFSQIPAVLRGVGASAASARFDEAVELVTEALRRTLEDDTGRWILRSHEGSVCEQPISGVIDGELVHCVIDRMFVDGENRWIIDWKSAQNGIGTDFEQDESVIKRYGEQLRRYARLVGEIEDRPIRAGVYMPMQARFVEVEV